MYTTVQTQAGEEPVQRPWDKGHAGGREEHCVDPPVTHSEWQPLRVPLRQQQASSGCCTENSLQGAWVAGGGCGREAGKQALGLSLSLERLWREPSRLRGVGRCA